MRNRGPRESSRFCGSLLELLGRGRRPTAGRRPGHHQPEELLHVPARLAELDRQPVEQFRVRGQLAGDAEVAAGAHEPGAEHLLPEAVHRHPGRQRMLRPQEPLGEAEPVLAAGSAGNGGRMAGVSGLHLVPPLVVLAAVEDEGLRHLGLLVHHVGDRAALADRGLLGLERRRAVAVSRRERLVERRAATSRRARRPPAGRSLRRQASTMSARRLDRAQSRSTSPAASARP